MKKGMLITFEGGDGCGKSTQLKLFVEYLKSRNEDFIVSREPGGTPLGEEIRTILLNSKYDISSEAEFLLFSACRATIVEKVVKPALDAGKIVVLDRYYDSSFTYQGFAGDLNIKDIKNITNFAIKGAKPDLTFCLDLSYEEAMKRKSQFAELDRMESKGKEYHDKVRNGYLTLAKNNPERMVVVDASKSIDEISGFIQETFEQKYKTFQSEQTPFDELRK